MDYYLIQYQILQIDIIRIVWQTVRRITNGILGVKGLIKKTTRMDDTQAKTASDYHSVSRPTLFPP